jgi:hypothetical protein
MEAKKIRKLVISRETIKELKLQTRVKTGVMNTLNGTCDTESCSQIPTSTFGPKPITG